MSETGQSRGDDVAYAAKGTLLQFLAAIAQASVYLHQLAVSNFFGEVIFGLYTGALAVLEVVSRLGIFGVDKGFFRYVAEHNAAGETEKARSALGTGLRISITLSIVVMVGTMVFAAPLAELMRKPEVHAFLPWIAPAALGLSLTTVLVAAALAQRKAHATLLVRGIAEPLFLVIAGVSAYLLFGASQGALAIAHAIAALLTAIVAFRIVAGKSGTSELFAALNAPRHPELPKFVRPLAVVEFINTLRQQLDAILLLKYLPLGEAGFYYASASLGRVGTQLRASFDGIAAPQVSEALAAGDREGLLRGFRRISRWVAMISLPTLASIGVHRESLLQLYGDPFVAAASVLLLHLFGHALNSIFGLIGHVIVMAGHARLMLLSQLAGIATTATLVVVLVPEHGLVGAGIAFAASMSVVTLGNILIAAITEGVHVFHLALLKPVVATALLVATQLQVLRFVDGFAGLVLSLLLSAPVYLGALWVLGLPDDEKEHLRNLLRRNR